MDAKRHFAGRIPKRRLGTTGQFNLGLMCLRGKGVPQDDGEAVKWFRRAAE